MSPAADIAPVPVPDRPTGRSSHRRVTGYDIAGLFASLLAMVAITLALIDVTNVSLGFLAVLRWTLGVGIALLVVIFAYLAGRDYLPLRQVAVRMLDVWRRPPGEWIGFAAGFLTALPALGLYSPVLMADADSARVVAAVSHVQKHGIGFLVETQDNLFPHLVLGPLVTWFGLPGARVFAIVSVILLSGVIGYIARRITSSTTGAVAAAAAVTSIQMVLDRAVFIPMYPSMLALGFLGCWLSYRAVTDRKTRWPMWVGASLCLALTPEAQAVGLLFLGTPLLLLLFATHWRFSLKRVGLVYATLIAFSIPRLILNLSDGGLQKITSYRTDYWITEGYVREIQRYFWGYSGVNETTGEYLAALPERFMYIMGRNGWIFLVLAALGLIFFCHWRAQLFAIGSFAVFMGAVVVKQIPEFPRYFSPLAPGFALLIGVLVAGLIKHRQALFRAAGGLLAVGLVALLTLHLTTTMKGYDRIRISVDANPFAELAAVVDDGKGVIGARSHGLVNVTADIPTWGGQFLSEDEYVTYLSWPSDDAVIDMMNSHNIGWILITKKRQLETDYHNTWLTRHHDVTARQIDMVAESSNFCLRSDVGGYLLYQLGSCGPIGG